MLFENKFPFEDSSYYVNSASWIFSPSEDAFKFLICFYNLGENYFGAPAIPFAPLKAIYHVAN